MTYVDPTGNFSMFSGSLGLMSSMSTLATSGLVSLGVTSGILFQFRANKMYDISIKKAPFLNNVLREYIPHTYINASEIEWTGNGSRYDKGCENRNLALYGVPTRGYVNKSPMDSSEWTNTSFVKLSPLQFTVWERENYDFVNNRHYQIIYSSCWTWTYSSWLSGVRIMLTIPSI